MLVTTFNRGPWLRRSLDRLAGGLTLPDQLIVVNDGGEEDCSEFVGPWSVKTGVEAMVMTLNNPGRTTPSKARNFGLRYCDGDILLVSEPEVYFISDVVAQVPSLLDHNALVAGTVYYAPADWDGEISSAELHADDPWMPPYVGVWRREWLETIGGWDEDFPGAWGGEDVDLFKRLEEVGVGREQAPEMSVVHRDHGTSDAGINMLFARANGHYLHSKPFWHGHPEHRCSNECMIARGVIRS